MSSDTGTVRVLHVDDDSDAVAVTAARLERADDRIQVTTATDAEGALDALATTRVDCVVSEYELPGTDGLELLRAVREDHEDLPFILFTGAGSERVAEEALAADATDYLRKQPGDERYTLLANRVVTAVEAAGARRHAERRDRVTELIRRVNRKLVEAETVAEIDRAVCETLTDSDTYLFAWIGEPAPDGRVVPRAAAGDAEGYLDEVEVRHDDTPRGRGPGGRAVRTREPQLVQPIEGNRSFEGWKDVTDRYGYESLFVVPLVEDDRLHGILPIYAAEPDAFDETEREVLEELGETVSRALGAARTRERLEEREQALAEIHATATDIATVETEAAACERTIEAARTTLEFHLCVISIEEDGYLPPSYASEDLPEDGSTLMSVEEGLVGKTYRTGDSFLIEDATEHPDADPQGAYRGALSIPVGNHGVFQAVAREVGAYDETDLELAETLVAYTATTLDRIERESELRRQNERLEEFASIVSHDLRNPLNVAQARLDLARGDCDRDHPHLDGVADAHRRMEELIDDLLTLARQGERVDDPEPVALGELVQRCWATVETPDAELSVEVDGTLRADETRLRQVFENLFRNAVEHGSTNLPSQAREDGPDDQPRAGEEEEGAEPSGVEADGAGADAGLRITVGACDGGFYVADDGPGIPEDVREQVFEAGYSTAENSTGFGLRIVEQAVEAHGWRVAVDESDGGGARFEITGVEFVEE